MSEKLQERLKAFTYRSPSQEVQIRMNYLRESMQDLCTTLDACLTESREKSLALTALEECSMWAMKCLSHHDSDDKQVSP